MTLFHVSETAGIRRFEPRASEAYGDVVWAIGERLLQNYLLPRDCPRVTFYADFDSTDEDVARFLGDAEHVVAVERAWLERIYSTALFLYEFDPASFEEVDEIAAYYVSRSPVVPIHESSERYLVSAIESHGSEFRTLPSLWELHDAVAASTLAFSMIRMRNAAR